MHLKKFQLKLSDSKCPAVNKTKTKNTKANSLAIFATSEHNISDLEKGLKGSGSKADANAITFTLNQNTHTQNVANVRENISQSKGKKKIYSFFFVLATKN